MHLLLAAVAILLLSGLLSLFTSGSAGLTRRVAVGGAVFGAVAGLVPSLRVLLYGPTAGDSLKLPWQVPYGSFSVALDPLSALFLVPIFGLGALAAIYGAEYLRHYESKKNLGGTWFFYHLLIAAMAMVVVARNGVLFLVAWEVMALASFFLVTFEHEREEVRDAGRVYLIATHLGTAFLLAMFIVLGRESGSLEFEHFKEGGPFPASTANLAFILALIGFGTKAGFVPLHVWLPEAHPAAPSHVSAIMSGVMIKTGIYGLVRTLTLLPGPPPTWWGWLLVCIGLSSGILGVLFALCQHDLKRLLAYHSVENIGIIALGIGIGSLGLSYGSTPMIVLGFGGGLLHVVNHALFKGLLFLGAGSVLHGTHTREMDHLGGLLKRMPGTAGTFLVGAAAISGLPPLNGFVSEFLIYVGAFNGIMLSTAETVVPGVAVIAGLALIGGLASACFTKAFGTVFLGEPRSEHATHAHECGLSMRLPMFILAGACLGVGLGAPWLLKVFAPLLSNVTGMQPELFTESILGSEKALRAVVIGGMLFIGVLVMLVGFRRWLLSGREIGSTGTWDCGYARPTARMQYTSSSFAQPLVELFGFFLRTRRKFVAPRGILPSAGAFESHTPDLFQQGLYAPSFKTIQLGFSKLRWLQHGQVQLYVLYIALALLALLVFKLG